MTVFHDDDEAADLWKQIAGLPDERIQRRGWKDNFWSTGARGPSGPCSEIYVDRGPEYGAEGGPVVDEDRYLEIWNLVFMQYERGDGGGKENFPILGDLKQKNIDTGMGLERVAYLLQGVDNLYEIDEVFPVIEGAQELSGKRYGAVARRRRAHAGRRGPRPQRAHAHGRRRDALERGPRLRAAAPAAPLRSARCACSASRTSRCRRSCP